MQRPVRVFGVTLGVLLGAGAASMAAAAGTAAPPTLRIVLETRAPMPLMREVLATRVRQCVAKAELDGKPVATPALPPDHVLANTPTRVTEMLFDGEQEARYTRSLSFFPDPAQACQVRALLQYEAAAARLCDKGWSGMAGFVTGHAAVGIQTVAPSLREKDYRGARCAVQTAAPSTQGLQAQPTQVGVGCYWQDEVLGLPKASGPLLRACLHPQVQYPVRKVLNTLLTLKLEPGPDGGPYDAMTPTTPELNDGRAEAVVLEQGKPIAAERFSKAAVQAFLQQPAWKSLGDL